MSHATFVTPHAVEGFVVTRIQRDAGPRNQPRGREPQPSLSGIAEDLDARDTLDCIQVPARGVGLDIPVLGMDRHESASGMAFVSCDDSINLVGLMQAE